MSDRVDRIIAVLQASKLPGARVEYSPMSNFDCDWRETNDPEWQFLYSHYRVLAPTAGKTRNITAKDWDGQATVWVRPIGATGSNSVGHIDETCFSADGKYFGFGDDRLANQEYSFTRKENDWHPFTVSEPGEMRVVASTEETK